MSEILIISEMAEKVHDRDVGSSGRLINLTSFIGRDQETIWVRERLLAGQRIVTITGPGGVGKTRLAAAIAASPELRFAFPNGVSFISLALISEASMVLPTIARGLGILADESSSAVDRLAAAIDQKRMLLVIDNMEHVIGAALDLKRFVDACENLSMLVTSRRAMRISGEQEFSLSPLQLPVSGGRLIEQMQESPAVCLFLDRATAANPTFKLTADNAAAIAEICQRLDGLPLALELAAARTKMLAPQALASRLTSRLQLLTTGPRDAPIRQQTLRETVRWSYDLLTPFEQLIFRRMSVFGGGAALDAIAAVAGHGAPISELEILDVVATLVDHSLLEREKEPDENARFRMLETIREFAIGELSASGELDRIRDAHAAYFLRQAEFSAWEYGEDEATHILAIEPDLANIRLALGWLLIDREFDSPDVHMGLHLAGSMSRFWDLRGYLTEGREWLIHALSTVPEEPTADRGTALTSLGVNAWFSGHIEDAEQWQLQALAIWRKLDMPGNVLRSLWFLALIAAKQGDLERLNELHMEAEPLADGIEESLWAIAPRAMQAMAALAIGDGATAMVYLQGCLAFHEEHRYHWPRAWTLGVMSEAATMQGDRAAALELMQASLSEFSRRGDVYAMLDGMLITAQHSIAFGDAETAAKLVGVVQRVRKAVGTRLTWTKILSDTDVLISVRAALGEAPTQEIIRSSGAMQLQDGVTLALSVRGDRAPVNQPAQQAGGFGLSPRELEILQLLAQGKSNQEIGDELFISHRTAGTHVANILGKLGVHSRAAAVAVAINNRLV